MSDHEKAIQIPSPRPQPQTSPNFDRPYGQVDHLSLGYLARHTKRHSPQLNLSPSPRQDDLPQFTQIQTKKHNLNIDIPTPIIQRKHHISQTGSLSPLNLSIDVPLADKIKWGVKLEESMNHIDHSEPKERKMRSISEDFPFPTQIDLLVIVVDAHTGLALPQATIQADLGSNIKPRNLVTRSNGLSIMRIPFPSKETSKIKGNGFDKKTGLEAHETLVSQDGFNQSCDFSTNNLTQHTNVSTNLNIRVLKRGYQPNTRTICMKWAVFRNSHVLESVSMKTNTLDKPTEKGGVSDEPKSYKDGNPLEKREIRQPSTSNKIAQEMEWIDDKDVTLYKLEKNANTFNPDYSANHLSTMSRGHQNDSHQRAVIIAFVALTHKVPPGLAKLTVNWIEGSALRWATSRIKKTKATDKNLGNCSDKTKANNTNSNHNQSVQQKNPRFAINILSLPTYRPSLNESADLSGTWIESRRGSIMKISFPRNGVAKGVFDENRCYGQFLGEVRENGCLIWAKWAEQCDYLEHLEAFPENAKEIMIKLINDNEWHASIREGFEPWSDVGVWIGRRAFFPQDEQNWKNKFAHIVIDDASSQTTENPFSRSYSLSGSIDLNKQQWIQSGTLSNIEWVWEDNEIAWGIRSLTLPNKQSRDWWRIVLFARSVDSQALKPFPQHVICELSTFQGVISRFASATARGSEAHNKAVSQLTQIVNWLWRHPSSITSSTSVENHHKMFDKASKSVECDQSQSQDPIIVENAKKNEMLHQLQISRPLSLYLSTVLKNGPDSIGLFPDIVSEVSDSDYINYYWDLMAINPSQSQYKIFNRLTSFFPTPFVCHTTDIPSEQDHFCFSHILPHNYLRTKLNNAIMESYQDTSKDSSRVSTCLDPIDMPQCSLLHAQLLNESHQSNKLDFIDRQFSYHEQKKIRNMQSQAQNEIHTDKPHTQSDQVSKILWEMSRLPESSCFDSGLTYSRPNSPSRSHSPTRNRIFASSTTPPSILTLPKATQDGSINHILSPAISIRPLTPSTSVLEGHLEKEQLISLGFIAPRPSSAPENREILLGSKNSPEMRKSPIHFSRPSSAGRKKMSRTEDVSLSRVVRPMSAQPLMTRHNFAQENEVEEYDESEFAATFGFAVDEFARSMSPISPIVIPQVNRNSLELSAQDGDKDSPFLQSNVDFFPLSITSPEPSDAFWRPNCSSPTAKLCHTFPQHEFSPSSVQPLPINLPSEQDSQLSNDTHLPSNHHLAFKPLYTPLQCGRQNKNAEPDKSAHRELQHKQQNPTLVLDRIISTAHAKVASSRVHLDSRPQTGSQLHFCKNSRERVAKQNRPATSPNSVYTMKLSKQEKIISGANKAGVTVERKRVVPPRNISQSTIRKSSKNSILPHQRIEPENQISFVIEKKIACPTPPTKSKVVSKPEVAANVFLYKTTSDDPLSWYYKKHAKESPVSSQKSTARSISSQSAKQNFHSIKQKNQNSSQRRKTASNSYASAVKLYSGARK